MRLPVMIVTLFVTIVSFNGCQARSTRSTTSGIIVKTPDSTVSVVFSDQDRRIINNYYASFRAKKTPPGLAKRDNLPPGLAKQVVKNGTLPPGLQGRVLPLDLESQLSQLPGGHARVIVDADLIILNTATRIISDVIKNVVYP